MLLRVQVCDILFVDILMANVWSNTALLNRPEELLIGTFRDACSDLCLKVSVHQLKACCERVIMKNIEYVTHTLLSMSLKSAENEHFISIRNASRKHDIISLVCFSFIID